MKKVKILFLTCLTGIVSVILTQVLVSCASEDGPLDSSNKQETSYEYEQLSEELNDYISQFVASHPTTALQEASSAGYGVPLRQIFLLPAEKTYKDGKQPLVYRHPHPAPLGHKKAI